MPADAQKLDPVQPDPAVADFVEKFGRYIYEHPITSLLAILYFISVVMIGERAPPTIFVAYVCFSGVIIGFLTGGLQGGLGAILLAILFIICVALGPDRIN